jgi:hypothetical protein
MFRPILALLLCMLVAFGQLPALVHMHSCHHFSAFSTEQFKPKQKYDRAHSCKCLDHDLNGQVAQLSVEVPPCDAQQGDEDCHDDGEHSHHEHDSDSCTICQSLLSLSHVEVGLASCQSEPLRLDVLLQLASILLVRAGYSRIAPRGPPLSIAA